MSKLLNSFHSLLLLVVCLPSIAQPDLDLVSAATGFNRPVDIASSGDGRLFIVEQDGLIRILDSVGSVLPTPFLDIDALVETYADTQAGMEMSENIFTKMHKEERNIAVIFMVDMSGSTKGWINDAERESLILLCEALETLGDRYAIYGFSGNTRKRCEIYKIKTFEDPYDDHTRGRITNITPQDYTRLGTFIRHFTEVFTDVEARTKLLITISDGKPEDYDGYRGDYGIEDTRMALFEAKREGVHPFCITIDKEARDYLQHMYGAANYVVLDEVHKLPLKVADIYRNITS